jgi:hypothetical protein
MERIKETVKAVMERLADKDSERRALDPRGILRKALTKKEREHIKFNYFKGGILNLNVDSSSWLYNLNLKKESLVARLNKKLKALKDIRFRVGAIK